jgi:hypothetical protein
MKQQTTERLGRTLAIVFSLAALSGGCAMTPPVGTPFDARAAKTLVVGQTSDKQALAALGAPYTATPAVGAAAMCAPPSTRPRVETWSYVYRDKKNNCLATLSFDDAGQLCDLTASLTVPGQLCQGRPR